MDSVSFHSKLAESWSSKYTKPAFRERLRVLARAFADFAAPGQRWLDAGCGTGEASVLLRTVVGQVDAIDASPEMVRLCTVNALVSSVECAPFDARTFDGIVCSSVLEYVASPEAVLREFHRLLKPKGCLLVSVPRSDSVLRRLQQLTFSLFRRPLYLQYSRHAFSSQGFDHLLGRNGFSPHRFETYGALRLHVAFRKPCTTAK